LSALSESAIPQDYRIDDVTALDAAQSGKLQLAVAVQEIHADVADQESPASGAGLVGSIGGMAFCDSPFTHML
jgi:hypothetical protein